MTRTLKRSSTRAIAGAALCAILPASPARAFMMTPPPVPRPVTMQVPSHLELGAQSFEASTEGLRSYVDSIRATDPALYAKLNPDVEHLEARRAGGFALLAGGIALGAGSLIYAFAGRKTCPEPSINDPFATFVAEANANASCNGDNSTHMATFGLLGIVLMTAGSFGAMLAMPARNDLLEVVNKRNRLTPEPMQLQLGYDPRSDFAYAGAKLTF